MSTEGGSDNSSLPILHFLNKSTKDETITDENKPESTATIQETNTKPSIDNDNDDKPIKTASHSRRVHFPTDDSQLRIVSNAPEPLANRPLQSLGVTLQRYRAVCQRLPVRPMNCLLDQLATMDDGRKSFFDRLEYLKIVNEKIDLKQVDAIEEILSRCRFYTLDLESTSIDDTSLSQLLEIIEYYESCTHINLSNHRSIGFQGYQSLSKYFRKTSCLERLDMNSMRFDDNSIVGFTRSLRASTTLYELHLESCQLSGKMLQKFIEYLRACISLRELYLGDNRLQVQDSFLINELIRTCGKFLNLLDLRSNSLQDTGMSHLASQFSQYDEHHCNENQLHKISFQNNQLTQQGVGFLAKALLHNRTIRSLNLSNNNITNEGLFLLRDALLTNRTVNELVLRNCRLTDQAAIALAEFIAESSTIQYIDLRENAIQASGICGMAIAIKNNKSLLQLDFDPIVSAPTNFSSILKSNNVDRAPNSNSNSLLSFTNLRRMTTGLGSFASSTPFQSNTGGGGTRELLEQKARWMNDIAAICQRNLLIYEEKLRLQEEEQNNPTTNGAQSDSTIAKTEDQSSSNKEIEQPPIDDNANVEQETNITINDNEEIEPPLPVLPTDNPEDANIEPPITIPTDEAQPPPPTDDVANIELSLDNEPNIPNQNSGSLSDDDVNDDDKRKFRHSDSIYLLRKKVKNEDNNTSDDESELSSIDEQMTDGVQQSS